VQAGLYIKANLDSRE